MTGVPAARPDPVIPLPTAGPAPDARALMRAEDADFRVEELMPVTLTGEGEHLWLQARKTGWNTVALADRLADHYGLRSRDIGMAGLKDRHAVTTQWFSLPMPIKQAPADPPDLDGVEWLAMTRHDRKLRRGTHRGNRFELCLRSVEGDRDDIEQALVRVRDTGVPNYFGAQRFGHGARNLDLVDQLFAGRRMKPSGRSFALSAARSHMFNQVLARRVERGDWNQLLPGEFVCLAGSQSGFQPPGDEIAGDTLQRRLAEFDIHPSGPLPGRGRAEVEGEVLVLENEVIAPFEAWLDGLVRHKVDAARRPLRAVVPDLVWDWPGAACLRMTFSLPAGSFATMVVREIASVTEPSRERSAESA
ncbi:tRNA pseudouridine(13) synthase TruD [Spectribacter hydrogenoxidans]|uniref:tRNA pseudouridine synthase D n=1 Tax=Spectribacter hydrogenoxidans TaxID=3075608 RepID=A0ABU3C1C9_9GAMM|nr:tRNA pseudouridine(13) synthase TruD [Salinisphaera sp. W335]MDT0635370.1 tRNA pseudouridine(13) synthase TruD [Salinisphaera sp. W335]